MGEPPSDPLAQSLPTHELVQRVHAIGPSEFRSLYERIGPSLHAWARLRLVPRGRRESEADDFLQEVWLRAWESFGSYDASRATFRAWIFGVAKNVAYETMRGRRMAQAAATNSGSFALDCWPDVATTIRSRLARQESIDLLLQAAARLDPLDNKLLLHCGFEDLSCGEAAVRLGISVDAAYKRWQRLRGKLDALGLSQLFENS